MRNGLMRLHLSVGIVAIALVFGTGVTAQQGSTRTRAAATQRVDAEYTAKIKEALQDPRITTELVDHLPASDTVPTPLKFLGRYVGQPGELTYARDIHRYYQELARVSKRARYWTIGKSEEGRDMVALAIADEATIASLEKYRDQLAALTDPRATTDAQAEALLKSAKPIYYITSGMHSPENGGPEMLIELAYRLIVQETPFVQQIRNNVITLITPVIEVDGREKQVDTYYYNKTRAQGDARLPLMYWGKYVQHDNNRDGMGQFLELTKAVTRVQLEWKPTIMHDLHEAQTYLYSSTGTGPYNDSLDPIVISEWWQLAQHDVLEMTKRGVPGVFTYGFYDGWVPNYMFFIAHSHNAIGRFYEVQSYGPDNYTARASATAQSKEWFRPNPPLPEIKWGPRNNTNIQQSALLFSLNHVAKNREAFLENYWLKNKRAVDKGKNGPLYAWHIPASQRRKADTADAVNELMRQGLEIHKADAAFTAGATKVAAGDYIVRGDQPYRTLADMYFSIQNYPPQNPRPYDDTGWTFQYMRDITIADVKDAAVLTQKMTRVTGPVKAAGGIEGTGNVLVVEHTADNALVTFRFKNPSVPMLAAEEDFELVGRTFRAGAIIVPDADRAALEPMLRDLGLSAWAVAAAPSVKTHDLDIPRIGYVHSWTRTQDEGWVRAALDTYGVPYTYFADQKLKDDADLRSKYDVIIYPHVGGSATAQVNGMAMTGSTPLPYRKTDKTPNLGFVDESDDIRGGMGLEGLANLVKFVRDGGTLITEGATSTILPQYGVLGGITVESPAQLFVRGSIVRGKVADKASPLLYGFDGSDLPVYFNQDPVLNVGAAPGGPFAAFFGGGAANAGQGQNVTPNVNRLRIQPLEGAPSEPAAGGPQPSEMAALRSMAAQFGITFDDSRPRVPITFSQNPDDLLLSGTLAGAQGLTGKAALVDASLGKGHVVMFAIRPFWRWQTQGTYSLGFNAIMNWNDLDAGRSASAPPTSSRQ